MRRIELALGLICGNVGSIDDLAAFFGCSRRTVFRDLQILKQSGFRVWTDTATRLVCCEPPVGIRPMSPVGTLMSPISATAVVVALELFRGGPLDLLAQPSEAALATFEADLDLPVRARAHRLASILRRLDSSAPAAPSIVRERLAKLVECALSSDFVEVTHATGAAKTAETRLRLDCIEVDDDGAYGVVGWSELAQQDVTIKAVNLRAIRTTADQDGRHPAQPNQPHFSPTRSPGGATTPVTDENRSRQEDR